MRNETGKQQYLSIFWLPANGRVRKVFPDGDSGGLISPASNLPLDVAVILGDNDVGSARIVGAFSSGDKSARSLIDAIKRGMIPADVHVVELSVEIDRR